MVTIADLKRNWLLKQLGLLASTLTQADLETLLYAQSLGVGSNRLLGNGRFYTGKEAVNANFTPTLDTLYLTSFEVNEFATFDQIAVNVVTAGTLANVLRMGVFKQAFNTTGALVANSESPTFDGTTTGNKIHTFSTPIGLSPGIYWLGVVSQVGTTCILSGDAAETNRNVGPITVPGDSNYSHYTRTGVSGALPAGTNPPSAAGTGVSPRVWLRRLS